jgi:hypothetical protein
VGWQSLIPPKILPRILQRITPKYAILKSAEKPGPGPNQEPGLFTFQIAPGTRTCCFFVNRLKKESLTSNKNQKNNSPSMCRCEGNSKEEPANNSKYEAYKKSLHSPTGKPFHRISTAPVKSQATQSKSVI